MRAMVAVTALLLAAGCGAGSDEPENPTPQTTSASGTTPDEPAPTTPTAQGVALTGVVGAADESGCLTLTTTTGTRTTWLLVGSTAGVVAGDRVTVRGSPAPDLATRCQQGTPFVVEAVEPG